MQATPDQTRVESLESAGFDDWSGTLAGCRHVSQYGTGQTVKSFTLWYFTLLYLSMQYLSLPYFTLQYFMLQYLTL